MNYLFPLYIFDDGHPDLFSPNAGVKGKNSRPNFSAEFLAAISAKLGLQLDLSGTANAKKTFGPRDIFNYAYAVFYSPGYRSRYAQFLKADYPRLPLTSDSKLFRTLCKYGEELVALHLMQHQVKLAATYPVAGDNKVDAVKYAEDPKGGSGRVWINEIQFFANVPATVWSYVIGGYQICQKWLKDRKGKQLSYDELSHYRALVGALSRTIELQVEIDEAIGKWPIQ